MEFITDASCSTHGIYTVLMPVLLIKELRLTEFNRLYAQEIVFIYIASSIMRFVQT